jgi:hypothetical protein
MRRTVWIGFQGQHLRLSMALDGGREGACAGRMVGKQRGGEAERRGSREEGKQRGGEAERRESREEGTQASTVNRHTTQSRSRGYTSETEAGPSPPMWTPPRIPLHPEPREPSELWATLGPSTSPNFPHPHETGFTRPVCLTFSSPGMRLMTRHRRNNFNMTT